jgi:hypothetical protein
MISVVLKQAWKLYRAHFGVIAAVVIVIWLPLNLLSSYMDYFVFEEDDFRKSFKFYQFLDNFVGIIATAGVIFIGYTTYFGQSISFGKAMNVGLGSWGRMWWTRFIWALVIILGILLLIIPGLYLIVRLAFVEPIAVCERVSGIAALRRSFELTKGRFRQVALLGFVFITITLVPIVLLILPAIFFPVLDHWLIDATTTLFADIIGAFGILCFVCAYAILSEEERLSQATITDSISPSLSNE